MLFLNTGNIKFSINYKEIYPEVKIQTTEIISKHNWVVLK